MHGAVLGSKHSREDYNAVMNYARITPPSVKENYVDIAGGDSSIDLTEAVGGVVFEDGKISFKFTLFCEKDKDRMKNDLHGKRLKITLEREPDFYYEGRLSFTGESMLGTLYELNLDARVKPYKMENQITIHEEEINAPKDILLINERMPAMLTITARGNIKVTYEGNSYELKTGIYEIPEITLRDGLNRLHVSGDGSVRLEYRKGRII
ncbi:MAG: hypothetical protein OSJ60_02005 [Lachnospiraceae bacterium]|nr:hypothetical protein C819_02224 [Lachnospiraceae bacterium 10-1]MCX4350387.1 hypothetical protein [Lachnospiraceae bacterium]